MGWDGIDPLSIESGKAKVYRNADFRVHALSADLIDGIFERLRDLPDFRQPSTLLEHKEFVRFKFRLVSTLHKRWLRAPSVGDRVDVRVWISENGRITKA